MRIEQLIYLVDIYNSGSIKASAERLYVTQPTISEAINKLEKELDTTLFVRHSRGMILTEDGEIVLKHAEKILKHLDQIEIELSLARNKYACQENITLVSTSSSTSRILRRILPQFIKEHPSINVHHYVASRLDILSGSSLNSEAEILTFHSLEEKNDVIDNELTMLHNRYFVEKVCEDSLYAFVNKAHILAEKDTLSLQMLMEYPLVLRSSMLYDESVLFSILSKYGNTEHLTTTSDSEIMFQYILMNSYNALMPRNEWNNFLDISPQNMKKVRLIPIEEEIHISYYVALRKEKVLSPAAQLLYEAIINCGC